MGEFAATAQGSVTGGLGVQQKRFGRADLLRDPEVTAASGGPMQNAAAFMEEAASRLYRLSGHLEAVRSEHFGHEASAPRASEGEKTASVPSITTVRLARAIDLLSAALENIEHQTYRTTEVIG